MTGISGQYWRMHQRVVADAFDDRVQSWESIIDRMTGFLHLRRIIE